MHRIKDNLSCMLLGKQNKEQYNKWSHRIFVSISWFIYLWRWVCLIYLITYSSLNKSPLENQILRVSLQVMWSSEMLLASSDQALGCPQWAFEVCLNCNVEASMRWIVLWRPTRPSRTNTKERWRFHHRGLECKCRKSRDTWSNRQVWSWSTKWSRAKSHRVLPRERTGHTRHPLATAQEVTFHIDITRWSITNSDWLHSFQPKMESSIQLAKTRVGIDCGSDCKLLVAKFKLKSQKVGKTSKPFRYDLNQISYDFAVEIINGFKGLDLIGEMHEELWVQVQNIVEEVVNKTIHKKKKGKMIVWGGLIS